MRRTSVTQREDYLYWPPEVLMAHIRAAQHRLLNAQLPFIREQFSLACDAYRKLHPEITGVAGFFNDVSNDLRREFSKDDELYFPYLGELVQCHYTNRQVRTPAFSSIGSVLHLAKVNHRTILKSLETIIDMTFTFNRFTQVDQAYQALLSSLNALEDELQTIVHLKFSILLQRGIEIENTVGRVSGSSPLPTKQHQEPYAKSH